MNETVPAVEPKQARPHDELICELLNSRLPKTEREHAAAREIERLRAEVDESDAVVEKLANLLAETAIVIKGPEPDMTKWSYHDIPDGVRAIQARAERLAEALRLIAAPKRPDGTWNRDREACRQIAAEALADLAQEDRND